MVDKLELDQNIYFKILERILYTYSAIMAEEGKIPESVIEGAAEQWVGVVDSNYSGIRNLVKSKIHKYINFYEIEPQGDIDEFKYIYFSGLVIAELLEKAEMYDHLAYHWKAIIRLLDYRIYTVYGSHRSKLTKRIGKAIQHRTIQHHFGEYGIYFLYKCLYNSIKEIKSQNIQKDE